MGKTVSLNAEAMNVLESLEGNNPSEKIITLAKKTLLRITSEEASTHDLRITPFPDLNFVWKDIKPKVQAMINEGMETVEQNLKRGRY